MKKIFFINVFIVLVQFCFSQKALKIQNGNSTTIHNEIIGQYSTSSQDGGLVGSWNQILVAFDDNSNGKLDEEERKKGTTNKHFYQFNSDGTCLVYTMKLKGSYEIKNEDGIKRLYTYVDDKGTKVRENAWYLVSVSKSELILMSQDKYAFWIFKRV